MQPLHNPPPMTFILNHLKKNIQFLFNRWRNFAQAALEERLPIYPCNNFCSLPEQAFEVHIVELKVFCLTGLPAG